MEGWILNKYKILYYFLILLGCLGLIYIYFNDPSENPFIPCLFHEITGLECTGCGITRAIYSLMHFNFLAAIKFNAMFVFSLPLFLFCYLKKLQDEDFEIKPRWLIIYAIVLLVFTFVRNFSPIF